MILSLCGVVDFNCEAFRVESCLALCPRAFQSYYAL